MSKYTSPYTSPAEYREALTKARKSKGLTFTQIADTLGVSRQAAQQWEVGRSAPSIYHQRMLVSLLGIGMGPEFLTKSDRLWYPARVAKLFPPGVDTRTMMEVIEILEINPTGSLEQRLHTARYTTLRQAGKLKVLIRDAKADTWTIDRERFYAMHPEFDPADMVE